jgi:hypothetical protein
MALLANMIIKNKLKDLQVLFLIYQKARSLNLNELQRIISCLLRDVASKKIQYLYLQAIHLCERKSLFEKWHIHYGEGSIFNPTIIGSDCNRLTLIARRVSAGIRSIELVVINKYDNSIESAKCINVVNKDTNWFADPRYFIYQCQRYISYNTGHSESPNRIFIHRITDNESVLGNAIQAEKSGDRRLIEKNWGFFELNNILFSVYSLSPLIVLEFIDPPSFGDSIIYGKEYSRRNWNDRNYVRAFGEPRGGASPVLVDGLYYCFFQSSKRTLIGDVYTGGVLTFKHDKAFIPIAITPSPVLRLNRDELCKSSTIPLNRRVACCAYTTGAIYSEEDKMFNISYGINDFAIGFCSLPKKDIDDRLVSIEANLI